MNLATQSSSFDCQSSNQPTSCTIILMNTRKFYGVEKVIPAYAVSATGLLNIVG